MRETTTLARRSETDERAERILADALRGKGGALTRADAISLSGLSADETDAALKSLLRDYKSHLAVTESGELVYKFDPAMVRRDAPTLAERIQELAQLLWRGFTFLFKIWIMVMLVTYVVAFVAMLIALLFAKSSSDRDDRRSSRSGGGMDLWLLYWLMPDWAPRGYYDRDRYGGGRQRPKGPQKRFYLSVFDFVFGPKVEIDALAAEKEVVGYLREKDGRLTTADLVALTGWGFDRADEEATRLLASYDGEPEVQEDGTIVYSFPELRKTAGDLTSEKPWRYAWGQKRALPPLTGNSSGANTAVTVMNGFNLIAALSIGPAFLAKYGIAGDTAHLFVTEVPLAFSAVFFAVPGARWIKQRGAAKRLAEETARASLIGEIFARKGAAALPDEIATAAAKRGADPILTRKLLEKLLVDLDGDVETDDAGKTLYAFPRIAAELTAVEAARRLAPHTERDAGQVVFSSEDDAGDADSALPPPSAPRRLH